MGVRGLTTYIANNSSKYLSKHKLHDCILVIDGNNLASQLYVWVSKSNSAFGGDYDRYYKCVQHFFSLLKECKVTPLVIFDGGYETRKLGTVWIRLRNKFIACQQVSPKNQTRKNVFPLMMRDQFRDILIELGISFAQCDFEADEEIAALARELECPVLSYDSDFFVHNVLYIPFNSFQLSVSHTKDKPGFSFIGCEIYKVDRFLAPFGGLHQDMLPLMATLLGNDYIKREVFDGFFSQIRLPKRQKGLSDQHRRIAGLIQWLRRETVKSAIPKILSHLKQRHVARVTKQMNKAIEAYALTTSHVRQYLRIPSSAESLVVEDTAPSSDVVSEESSDDEQQLSEDQEVDDVEAEQQSEDQEDQGSETEFGDLSELQVDDTNDDDVETPKDVPDWFLQKYRQGLLPACFMDVLTKSKFYILQPQKEDFSMPESSHTVSLPLIRNLITLIVGPEKAAKVKIVTRHRFTPSHRLLFKDQEQPNTTLPALGSLSDLPEDKRLALLLQSTGLNISLKTIPEEWRLYFLAIAFWASHCRRPPVIDKHVHAVVLGAILLSLVHPSRKEKTDNARPFGHSCESPESNEPDIKTALLNIKTAEYNELYSTIYVPHSRAEGRNQKAAYDLSVVHNFAQLQSVLQALNQLNQLLGMPLKRAPLHRLFSGTLLYNLQRALQPRPDVNAYISSCLKKSPTVLCLHQALTTTILQHFAPSIPCPVFKSRRKKRKRADLSESSGKEEESNKKIQSDSDSDSQVVDPNNRFAVLLNM